MYNKVAVIGDEDSILAFKAAGFEIFNAVEPDEVRQIIRDMTDYAVVYLTEDVARTIPDIIKKAKTKAYPILIPIPTAKSEDLSLGMQGIKKDVEKALGVDMLFKK